MEMREGKTGHYKLRDHVQEVNKHQWPTPTTHEIEHPDMEVTDTGRRLTKDKTNSHSIGLADAVRWPTPTTRDHKDTGDSVANGTVPVNGYLGRAVSPSKAEGALNPDWVEWLMGWPIYWTDLEPLRDISYWEENIERWWDEDPAESGHIPRITTQKKNRVNRLKAIGNGQVPLCAAVAFLLLQGDLL